MASQYVNGREMFSSIYFFTAMQLAFFIHVFSHLGQSLFFRSVTPGVITSILIVLPYSVLMLNELLSHQFITWKMIWACFPFVFLMFPIVFIAHWIGKKAG
jgi:hypothetical protein